MKGFRIIGKPTPTMEGDEKVTGSAKFVDDMKADLQAKILRSPHPHARIKNIDTSEAEKLPGVGAIVTYEDVPKRLMPRNCARACYILEDRVRFVGDEVAGVAAVSKDIAEEALDLIKVEYEVLPAVFDPEEAMRDDAPKIYPEGNVYGPQFGFLIEKGIKKPFVCEWGDSEEGLRKADVIIEDSFVAMPQIHSPIETHVCIAKWQKEKLTIWAANQVPSEVVDAVSYVFEIPQNCVRVLMPNIGGGFGSKYIERYIPIAALLSKKAGGKSVKLRFTRQEELTHVKRAMHKIYVKVGAKKDGSITSIYYKGIADLGGYGNAVGGSCAFWEETPVISYKTADARFEYWDVHTNHFSTQPFRAVHLPAALFAFEQVIDKVAEKLGTDPIEFRLRNMPKSGDMMPPEPYKEPFYPRARLTDYPGEELMQMVMKEIRWEEKRRGWRQPIAVEGPKRRGIGVGYSALWGGYCFDGYMTMSVTINPDGSATILSSATDIGTGLNTSLRMLAAEYFGLKLEDVDIVSGDTATGQFDYFGAKASRELATGGALLLHALDEATRKIREMAAKKLEAPAEEIEVKGKKVWHPEKPEGAIGISQVITSSIGGSATGPPGSLFPESFPGYKERQPAIAAAEVEVDIETGQARILKCVTGNFPGIAINPNVVLGQYQGGAMQGIGYALQEIVSFNEEAKSYLNTSFLEYQLPTAYDAGELKSLYLEKPVERSPNQGCPYGAMAVGECALPAIVPAIANAIYIAIGARVKECPMTPAKIFGALKSARKDAA